jgi:hypothetical protein
LDHPRTAKEDGYRELELSTVAVTQLAKMLRDFKDRYHKRWHGQLTGASRSGVARSKSATGSGWPLTQDG